MNNSEKSPDVRSIGMKSVDLRFFYSRNYSKSLLKNLQGTAIIQFNDEESTKKAIDEYNGAELDGQKLVIEYYKKELVPMLRRSGGIQKDRFRQNRGGFPMRKYLFYLEVFNRFIEEF